MSCLSLTISSPPPHHHTSWLCRPLYGHGFRGTTTVVFGEKYGRVTPLTKMTNGCLKVYSFSIQGSGGGLDSSSEDDDDDELEEGLRFSSSSCVLPDKWDVLGLGQAMVDFSGMVDDDFLHKLELDKGTRKLVNHEERGRVLRAMDGCTYKAAAGGSLSNSLVALARLGIKPIGGPPLNVAMAGSVGSDPLGGFYRTGFMAGGLIVAYQVSLGCLIACLVGGTLKSKLHRANVNFLSAPVKDGTTGTVIVLTTPDAQRTMLAYQGNSSSVNYDTSLASIISKTNIFIVEGYLFEFPDTIRTIAKACEEARRNGAMVAVTASDVSCIERHYDDFWEIIGNYADIVFPSPCVPVDTCGAGDAYASGILYGLLRGVSDLKRMGNLAARIASTVVGQQGTRLGIQDAISLAESFAFNHDNSSIRSDVGSDQISSL
ncbi:hypothetical protein ACFE04_028998 [Oxalis oulophora]